MALLLKCGAIFLHIPKTGGSWVTHVLKELDLVQGSIAGKHDSLPRVLYPLDYLSSAQRLIKQFPLKLVNKLAPPTVSQYNQPNFDINIPYIFCFVRHPLSWYESWWKYMSARNWQSWGNEYDYTSSWHPNAILNDFGDGDFNTFVRKVIRKRPGYVTEFYGWYTQPGVRFIGKQETLVDDLIYVLRQINIKFDEERLKSFQPKHVSKSPNKPIVWDEELKIEVERLEYASLIRYGYPTPYSNK